MGDHCRRRAAAISTAVALVLTAADAHAAPLDAGTGQRAPAGPGAGAAEHRHAEREFGFALPGRVAALAPYFGPVLEAEWSSGWHPEFVFPAQATQAPGAIFRIESEWGPSVWVLDRYEPDAGRIGYVVYIHGVGVTRYDITLTQATGDQVHVRVWCSRTALERLPANYLDAFERHFADQGPHWQRAIAAMLLRKSRGARTGS